jgi:hypothetical protein
VLRDLEGAEHSGDGKGSRHFNGFGEDPFTSAMAHAARSARVGTRRAWSSPFVIRQRSEPIAVSCEEVG